MDLQEEHPLDCPACGETVTVLVDLSVPRQTYVEDCEVCCRPMVVTVAAEDGQMVELTVRPEND